MSDPHLSGTPTLAPTPGPTSTAPARSQPLWPWVLYGVVATATLAFLVTVAVVLVRGAQAAGDDRATGLEVVVDGQASVDIDGATVVTPCFRYRIPDGLELNWHSSGCVTAVGVGHDYISEIRVGVQTGGAGDLDEVAGELRRAMAAARDLEMETVTVAGRDSLRIRNVNGWGISMTSYLVPLPPGRFAQAGEDLDSIWVTGPSSPAFDGWMSTVVGSLEIPGD